MPSPPALPYRPPLWLPGGHAQTIYPVFFRPRPQLAFVRERVDTRDGDFLDIDWLRDGHRDVAVLVHGLEGSSRSHYMMGLARAFQHSGWDVAALSLRGCSGEPNRGPRTTHGGATDDLDDVVQCLLTRGYRRVALAGCSMGGNQVLRYLGEDPARARSRVYRAAVMSVPVAYGEAASWMNRLSNRHYRRRFMRSLRRKAAWAFERFPDRVPDPDSLRLRTFQEFDDAYTAPLNGFRDAADYYARVAALPFLTAIPIPTLLLNARNDPFLPPACYPEALLANHPHVRLEIPSSGGHAGFPGIDGERVHWSEWRLCRFVTEEAPNP